MLEYSGAKSNQEQYCEQRLVALYALPQYVTIISEVYNLCPQNMGHYNILHRLLRS